MRDPEGAGAFRPLKSSPLKEGLQPRNFVGDFAVAVVWQGPKARSILAWGEWGPRRASEPPVNLFTGVKACSLGQVAPGPDPPYDCELKARAIAAICGYSARDAVQLHPKELAHSCARGLGPRD